MSTRFSPTLRDSLSVSITVGAYGVAFGAAAVANGFSVLQACLLSLLTFSGASQFAVVGVISAGGSSISAIAAASLLGTRNALYGVIMAPRLKVRGFKRIVAAQVTIDESNNQEIVYDPMDEINEINEIKQMSLAVEKASALEETAEVSSGLMESEASSSLLNEITMGSEILLS